MTSHCRWFLSKGNLSNWSEFIFLHGRGFSDRIGLTVSYVQRQKLEKFYQQKTLCAWFAETKGIISFTVWYDTTSIYISCRDLSLFCRLTKINIPIKHPYMTAFPRNQRSTNLPWCNPHSKVFTTLLQNSFSPSKMIMMLCMYWYTIDMRIVRIWVSHKSIYNKISTSERIILLLLLFHRLRFV